MSAIIRFDSVSKQYRLRRDRPRSFREAFSRLLRRTAPAENGREWLWALKEASFEIKCGETVGLIGANGAGKSTTLKLISRVAQPTSGQIEVNGRIGALLELGAGFHPELSGRDNVYLSGALIGMGRREMQRKFDSIVAFSELEEFIDVPVKHYSSGMYARLGFAVSIHLEPEVLLVDEVLAVGDMTFQRKCLDRIEELRGQGVTICFVSHTLDTVQSLCSRALWFDRGHLVADGPADAVVQQYHDRSASVRLNAMAGAIEAEQRWGNRKVEITHVRFLDAHGDERQVFRTGEALVVELEYQAHQAVQSPVVGIGIHRVDGVHVCGPNTGLSGVDLGTLEGRGTIRYTIACLPLLEGLYQLSVGVVNKTDTEMFDFHDRAYGFRVSNGQGGAVERYGLVTVQGEWEQHADAPM